MSRCPAGSGRETGTDCKTALGLSHSRQALLEVELVLHTERASCELSARVQGL